MIKTVTVVRRGIGNNRDFVTVLAHDGNSGSSGAAVFVCLLHVMERIDDLILASARISFNTQKNEEVLNIFNLVDEVRSKRKREDLYYDQLKSEKILCYLVAY